jgi:hypothetical protein
MYGAESHIIRSRRAPYRRSSVLSQSPLKVLSLKIRLPEPVFTALTTSEFGKWRFVEDKAHSDADGQSLKRLRWEEIEASEECRNIAG